MELDYYHQKVNVRVVLRVVKRRKTGRQYPRNSRKSLRCLDPMPSTQKTNSDICAKDRENSAKKHSIGVWKMARPHAFLA